MINFPAVLSSGVIPIDNPVVPKAEETSKTISMMLNDGSSIVIKIIEDAQMNAAVVITMNDP